MMISPCTSALRFASALSRDPDPEAAGLAISQAVRSQMGEGSVDLAFLFLSNHYARRADVLSATIRKVLTPGVLTGSTGEGIIAGSEEIETAPAVTLWAARLPGTTIQPMRLAFSRMDDRLSTAGWPERPTRSSDIPAFVLLADPLSTPMKEVLSMMAERYPASIAIGGLAGGGQEEGENRLLLNEEVHDHGLVGVALSGTVSIHSVISQGCRPIGDRYVVTKAENNVIHELGGVPALQRLQAVFESLNSDERRTAHRALHLGIVIDEHRNRFERGDFLIRNLIGADQTSGAVAIGDVLQEGQTVQFHVRDAASAHEDLNLLLATHRTRHKKPPLGALLFSCCGRGHGLFGRAHHDSSVLREHLGEIPTAGFFAQGEIGPVGGGNFLHGYTASVALFSESSP
ncbi:MAG: FIST signal transduction protein [Nitrospiraceae bacterium]